MKGSRFYSLPGSSLIAVLVMTMVAVGFAFAGGFYISVEQPQNASDPHLKDAVLVVRADGCHQPSDAKISAIAEGVVDGKRRSLPLRLREVGEGVYAIHQQWPSNGSWVVAVTGMYLGHTRSVLVELGANGAVVTKATGANKTKLPVRMADREFSAREIDAALASVVRNGQRVEALVKSAR